MGLALHVAAVAIGRICHEKQLPHQSGPRMNIYATEPPQATCRLTVQTALSQVNHRIMRTIINAYSYMSLSGLIQQTSSK